jgi:hypothetical protein
MPPRDVADAPLSLRRMPDRSRRPAPSGEPPRSRVVFLVPGAAAACAALAACGPDPVTWDGLPELRFRPPPASAAAAPDAAADTLVRTVVTSLRSNGWANVRASAPARQAAYTGAEFAPAPPAPPLAAEPPDPTGARCPLSLRVVAARAPAPAAQGGVAAAAGDPHAAHAAPAAGGAAAAPAAPAPAAGTAGAAAVWWAQRPDRSAALYLSRTADGGRTWTAPLAVDTLDRSEAGCDRPAPSVAVDSANGYLHVAYSMRAPEGPGVFYAHQMDPRGPFERPQAIVYGERPAATSVASAGDRVVVAYEDPNTGGRPFVSLALSRTAGHSWAERVPVSAGNVAAERPVVALRGAGDVVLGWVERAAPRELATTDDPRAAVAPLPSGVVVRVGRLRE